MESPIHAAPRLGSQVVQERLGYYTAKREVEADWSPGATPRIINVDKVSKEVADLVAKAYRALVANNGDRKDDVIRFTLQCIVAMFAEDIGLPKEFFTTLLYRAGEEGGAEAGPVHEDPRVEGREGARSQPLPAVPGP